MQDAIAKDNPELSEDEVLERVRAEMAKQPHAPHEVPAGVELLKRLLALERKCRLGKKLDWLAIPARLGRNTLKASEIKISLSVRIHQQIGGALLTTK